MKTARRSEKKTRRANFKAEEAAVRKILNDWDTTPGLPEDEYDCLVYHVLSALHRGSAECRLEEMIRHELEHHFGFKEPVDDARRLSEMVWEWWTQSRL